MKLGLKCSHNFQMCKNTDNFFTFTVKIYTHDEKRCSILTSVKTETTNFVVKIFLFPVTNGKAKRAKELHRFECRLHSY